MTSEPVRLGIAGFGRLVEAYYLPALRSLDGVRVTAITDPLEARRALATALLPQANTYTHHEAMLERETLDAVLVATPPSTHLRLWDDARALALPVFMEKPFGLDTELARLQDSASDRSLLMVNFNRRFWPPYQRLKSVLQSGSIGEPEEAAFALHVDLPKWCSVTDHRLAPAEGGALYDLGSQVLDLVRDIVGREPRDLFAETWTERWNGDHVRLSLTFAGGLTVRCSLAYENRTRETAHIRGTRGSVYLNDPNMAVHVTTKAAPAPRWSDRCTDAAVFAYRAIRRRESMGRQSIRASLEAFLGCLRTKERFSPGWDDAVMSARWLEAASRSIAEQRVVTLASEASPGAHGIE